MRILIEEIKKIYYFREKGIHELMTRTNFMWMQNTIAPPSLIQSRMSQIYMEVAARHVFAVARTLKNNRCRSRKEFKIVEEIIVCLAASVQC